MDGVLNINKPSGMTSHDVVQQVRRMLKEKRIGHTGTLDPMATGVLVLCVGKATRVARFFEAGEKEYQAVLRLGVTTDTLDADGCVIDTRSYAPLDLSKVEHAVQNYIGSIMQRPPAYSAIKVGGVPSYKLAREGRAEPLKPRQVTIHGIEITGYDDPFIRLTVKCSKGVYIRTLCSDLGETLGTGGHLTSLVRTRSGKFTLGEAKTLDQMAALSAKECCEQLLIPMDEALDDFQSVTVSKEEASHIAHGNRIRRSEGSLDDGILVRIRDDSGRFLALARTDRGELRPELVFC